MLIIPYNRSKIRKNDNLEIGMKTLQQNEYQKLQGALFRSHLLHKRNYCLDTPSLPSPTKLLMRIRTFENSAELITNPTKSWKYEYNQDLSLEEANHCLKECIYFHRNDSWQVTSRGLSTSGWVVSFLTTVRLANSDRTHGMIKANTLILLTMSLN